MVRYRAVRLPQADVGAERPDYADSFEIRLPEPDDRTAEQWVRSGLENAPSVVRRTIRIAHRHVLGFRLGPHPSAGHVLGWRIARADDDLVRLETSSALMRAAIVGRRLDPCSTRLTTLLFYERPGFARLIWAVVGPVHRRIAPLLLARAARG